MRIRSQKEDENKIALKNLKLSSGQYCKQCHPKNRGQKKKNNKMYGGSYQWERNTS